MKKIFALLFSLTLILSMTACLNDSNDKDGDGANSNTSEISALKENDQGTPTFDSSWTDNQFLALIPKIPFDNWKVTEQTDSKCKIEIGNLKTVWDAANPANNPDGADKYALIQYLESLKHYGFKVEEIGELYNWLVTDANGNTAEFMCGDSFCWITIRKA